mmetsp:Transcript_14014/g.43892  ORF Transcript_14014/g.43892 Transcript_14014/m.43892 type:complete len:209 (-) Transcript_14014:107-733(-)
MITERRKDGLPKGAYRPVAKFAPCCVVSGGRPTRHPTALAPHLRAGARGEALARRLLARQLARRLGRLGHRLLLGRQDEVDVARRALVGVDAAMRAVRTAALVHRLLHLDVLDHHLVGVKTLRLGVGRGVAQQVEQEFAALDRPAALAVGASLRLGLRRAPHAAAEAAEDNAALAIDHRLEVRARLVEAHAADGHGRLARVLEVHAQV